MSLLNLSRSIYESLSIYRTHNITAVTSINGAMNLDQVFWFPNDAYQFLFYKYIVHPGPVEAYPVLLADKGFVAA